jgi:hypothetical protein
MSVGSMKLTEVFASDDSVRFHLASSYRLTSFTFSEAAPLRDFRTEQDRQQSPDTHFVNSAMRRLSR